MCVVYHVHVGVSVCCLSYMYIAWAARLAIQTQIMRKYRDLKQSVEHTIYFIVGTCTGKTIMLYLVIFARFTSTVLIK